MAAHLSHQMAGRARFRLPERRGDRPFFDALARKLQACKGVNSVVTNPRTGSILIFHNRPLEAILDELRRSGGPPLADGPGTAVSTPAVAARGNRNGGSAGGAVLRTVMNGGLGTLYIPFGLAMLALGVSQARRGNITVPAITAFMYGTQLLQSAQPAIARMMIGTQQAPAQAPARRNNGA